MSKWIQLPHDRLIVVDDADLESVAQFRWHARPHGRTIYAQRHVRRADGVRTTQQLHTFLTGWPRVDHADGNGLNNQRANLRPASQSENSQNRRKHRGTSSQYKGVSRHARTGRWQAYIGLADGDHYLGLFADPIAAARAYDEAARSAFGEFAKLNFSAT